MNEQPEKKQPDLNPEDTDEVPAASDPERTSEVPAVSIPDDLLISRVERPPQPPAEITPDATAEVPAASSILDLPDDMLISRIERPPQPPVKIEPESASTPEAPKAANILDLPDDMLISRIERPPQPAPPIAEAEADSTSEVAAASDAPAPPAVPEIVPPIAAESTPTNRPLSVLTSTRARLQLGGGQEWREVVYTPEIDALLATLALENDEPSVSEAAARAIGRIRSEAAVKVLAERQRKGERRALRALALVRDEAPSLPKSVSRQARLYTWLANTWRRLSEQPAHIFVRYICAAIFGGLAIGYYAYTEYYSNARGLEIQLVLDIWGKTLTNGIAFGVVFGLVVLLAAEIPERLRGFWPWWARLVLNLLLGTAAGAMLWVVYNLFFLYNMVEPSDTNILVGGLFIGLGFSLGVVFRIPGWLGALWLAALFGASLTVTYYNYMPPLIYIFDNLGQTIEQFAIPMGILVGVGSYLPLLFRDARILFGRGRDQYRRMRAARRAEASARATT